MGLNDGTLAARSSQPENCTDRRCTRWRAPGRCKLEEIEGSETPPPEASTPDTPQPDAPPPDTLTWEMFRDRFIPALGPFAPGFARETLARHAWLVRQKNQVMNLTRVTDPESMAIRHTADSLAALPLLAEGGEQLFRNVLDVGTGAGWPGLSIAIACPHLKVTLLDSTRKKIDFLQTVVNQLGLQDRVTCVWGRFEEWIRDHRKEVDLVTARAVGPVERLLGWCTNSYFGPMLLWKGPAADGELKAVEGLMWKRRLFVALDEAYQIPGDEAVRRLILIDHQRK